MGGISQVGGPGYGGYQPIGKSAAEQIVDRLNTVWARGHDMSGQIDENKVLDDFREIRDAVSEIYTLIPSLPRKMQEEAASFCMELETAISHKFYMNVGDDAKVQKDLEGISDIMRDFKSFLGAK
jgi:hypothetical protein